MRFHKEIVKKRHFLTAQGGGSLQEILHCMPDLEDLREEDLQRRKCA